MWTAIRRRTRQGSKGVRHYATGACIACYAILIIVILVRSFIDLPAALQLSQRCRMSRMWPSYIPYEVPSSSRLSKKYRLFLYREAYPGRDDSQNEPRGRPALFIPGNAGSFGQVRSVASSAQHLYQSGQGGDGVIEVDWWTVDFNEDFSAFHGQTMHDQAEYINEVLSFLLKKYPKTHQIPVLAHSMGGIVARLMMLKQNHPPGSVDTIITLSSPHAYPPVPLDGGVEQVYDQVNTLWEETARDTLLISLSGGILDNQLSSEPASLPLARIWYDNSSLSAFTATLPGLWSGVDHLAMMWCDQLRERIARGVLRIEGRKSNLSERKDEWRRMLGIEDDYQAVSLDVDRLTPPEGTDGHSVETIMVADAGTKDDAFEIITGLPLGLDSSFGPPIDQIAEFRVDLCSRTTGNGLSCRHVLPSAYNLYPPSPRNVQEVQSLPSFPVAQERYEVPRHGLRRLYITLDQLKEQHIDVIRIETKTLSDGLVWSGWTERTLIVTQSSPMGGRLLVPLEKELNTTHSPSKSTIIAGMDSSLMAYDLVVLASKNVDPLCQSNVAPMLRAQSLSTSDTQYYPSIYPGARLTLTLHSTSPYMPPAPESRRGTKFTLLLDPCTQVSGVLISINWTASIGLLLSRYRTALGAFPLAALLLLMSVIFEDWDQGAPFPSLSTAAIQYAPFVAPFLVLTSVLLSGLQKMAAIRALLSSQDQFPSYIQNLTFGIVNSSIVASVALGFLFLTTAYGLCLIVSVVLNILIQVLAFVVRMTGAKAGVQTMGGRVDTARRLRSTAITFLALAVVIWLVVPVQFVFLVLFVVQLYCAVQANLAEFAVSSKNEGKDTSRVNQQILLLNLYFWLLPFNAPALLIWTRNLTRGYYGAMGGPDHNILNVIGFSALSQISSGGEVLHRSQSRFVSSATRTMMAAFSLLSIAYGIRYTYIILRFANIVAAWLAVVHFIEKSRMRTISTSTSRLEDEEVEELEPLKMQADMHSIVPETVIGSDSLPDSLIASLKSEAYRIKDVEGDNNAQAVKLADLKGRDALMERYLDTLDEYFACQKRISNEISNGHFQLSKARMQLGRLTSMNEGWDARMKTSWAVKFEEGGKATLERKHLEKSEEEKGTLIEEKGETFLRRRKGIAVDSIVDRIAESKGEKEKEKDTKRKLQRFDPLYQFTALPPPSLRQAQNSFTAALDQLIQGRGFRSLLQIQSELKHLEQLIEKTL